jgi:tRNA dimethylallyltransferase
MLHDPCGDDHANVPVGCDAGDKLVNTDNRSALLMSRASPRVVVAYRAVFRRCCLFLRASDSSVDRNEAWPVQDTARTRSARLGVVHAPVPTVVAVVGPTAVGKSDLSIALARALGGEVINADSMQLYRGMDIGTAKLPEAERGGVPHHLLDLWPVTKTASVAEYQRAARSLIDALLAAGRVPILVGGSGLYLRAALDDFEFPGTDAQVRARLEAELVRLGAPALHARLASQDPAAGAAILPSNGRRIVRALEVIELTGRPFAARLPRPRAVYPMTQLGLRAARERLDERIAARVDWMWAAGLVDEVRQLERAGLRQGVTASRALGYAQVLRMLDGDCDEAEARAETVRATRRFARRQESWFRRDPRVHWLDHDRPDLLDAAVSLLQQAT